MGSVLKCYRSLHSIVMLYDESLHSLIIYHERANNVLPQSKLVIFTKHYNNYYSGPSLRLSPEGPNYVIEQSREFELRCSFDGPSIMLSWIFVSNNSVG